MRRAREIGIDALFLPCFFAVFVWYGPFGPETVNFHGKGLEMRSLKLFAIAAAVAALVAGPVMAQDAMAPATGADTATTAPATEMAKPAPTKAKKHAKKHAAKKHHGKKSTKSMDDGVTVGK